MLAASAACVVERDTELATCYGLLDGRPIAFEAPRDADDGWSDFTPIGATTVEATVEATLAVTEPDVELPYIDPEVLPILVEEWREDNRPDLDAATLIEIATKYCTAQGEDPLIVAMLIDNGEIEGVFLEFLTAVCPELIAIYDATL